MNSMLILSDSHTKDIKDILEKEKADYVVHLGDSQLVYNELDEVHFKIKGNCDYDSKFEEEVLTNIKDIGKVFFSHGHLRNVNYNLFDIKEFCKENNIKLCLYGHTHILSVEYLMESDLLVVNPGSIAMSRNDLPETYVILKYDEEFYEVIIKGAYSKKEIKTLKIKRNNK